MFIRYFVLFFLVFWGFGSPLRALSYPASKPYLVSATINISVNDQADIWLNGVHIAHYPHTTAARVYRILEAKPDSLCLFKDDNVLAIRLQASKNTSGERYIGIAYFMFLRFSDGSTMILDSSEAGEHRSFYMPHRDREEPAGWQNLIYNDSAWPAAQSSGDRIPDTGNLTGGNFGRVPGFLSATADGYFAKFPGEKQLFRRRFHLDIGVNPRCRPKPSPRRYYLPVKPVKTSAGFGSLTPVVLPIRKEPLAAAPQLKHVRPLIRRRAYLPIPTWTPTIVVLLPTPTLAPWSETPLPTAVPVVQSLVAPTYTPFVVPTPIVQDDGAILFGQSSANILVILGDGPGYYKVEAVDDQFRHLKTLLNQHIVSSSEMWLSWDGKNDAGQNVPDGKYYILCTKEGTLLQKIILRRVSQ